MPSHPTFFTKAPTAVNGPCDCIPLHAGVTEKVDWEVEPGVIIGRGGVNIKEADAMKHVFGYTVISDVSAHEVQRRHGQQWFKGKLSAGMTLEPGDILETEIAGIGLLRNPVS